MSKLPRVNLYTCEYGCQNITVDVDKGVTPFMIKCRRKSTKTRPIAKIYIGDDGECTGLAKSNFYPTKGVPSDVMTSVTHEWYRMIPPNFHNLTPDEMTEVGNQPLMLRERTNREPLYHND